MLLKDPITLRQLLQYLDSEDEVIQISTYGEWERVDEFWANSPLLEPFLDYKIMCLGAIDKDTIRVTLDLSNKEVIKNAES